MYLSYRSNILYSILVAHFLHFHHGVSDRSSSSTALASGGTALSTICVIISIHCENTSLENISNGSTYCNRIINQCNKCSIRQTILKFSLTYKLQKVIRNIRFSKIKNYFFNGLYMRIGVVGREL